MPKDNVAVPAPVADANSMFIDTDNFNFFDLEDVVQEDANELGYSTKQTSKDLLSADDIKDLIGDDADEDEEEVVDDLPPEDEDEDEDSDEDEPSDEDSDEDGEDPEEGEDSPDEEEVDFETYEVTLPDGDVVNLSEAIQGYRNAETLKAERAEFEAVRNDFVQKSEGVTKMLELARLEADKVIEDYEDFDWASYKKDDPVGYVENREFLDRYKARRVEIVNAMEELATKARLEEEENFKEKAREAGVILARDIPGWNNELYQQLIMYAVENGAVLEDVKDSIDPALFKVLHKAMQYEKGKQIVKAKVKKIGGSPKKVVKASAKPASVSDVKGASKKAIIKKMESGGLSEKELSNSFQFLED